MQHEFGVIQLTFDPQPGQSVLCHDHQGRTFVVELMDALEYQDDGSVDYWLAKGPSGDPADWMTLDADLFVGLVHATFGVEL